MADRQLRLHFKRCPLEERIIRKNGKNVQNLWRTMQFSAIPLYESLSFYENQVCRACLCEAGLKIAAPSVKNWQSYGLWKFDLNASRLITLASM